MTTPRRLFETTLSEEELEYIKDTFGDVAIKKHIIIYWQLDAVNGFTKEYLEAIIRLVRKCNWSCTIYYNSKSQVASNSTLREFFERYHDILHSRTVLAKNSDRWSAINRNLFPRVEDKSSIQLRADFLYICGGNVSLPLSSSSEPIEEIFLVGQDLMPVVNEYAREDSDVHLFIRKPIRIVEWPEENMIPILVRGIIQESRKYSFTPALVLKYIGLELVKAFAVTVTLSSASTTSRSLENVDDDNVSSTSSRFLVASANSSDDSELGQINVKDELMRVSTTSPQDGTLDPKLDVHRTFSRNSASPCELGGTSSTTNSASTSSRKRPASTSNSAFTTPDRIVVADDLLTANAKQKYTPTLWRETSQIGRSASSMSMIDTGDAEKAAFTSSSGKVPSSFPPHL